MSPLVAASILLSITLLVSGLAKAGGREARERTQDAMRSLRLPARSLHPLAAAAVPIAEIAAALALWIPWVPLQIVLSAAILALMLAYLVIIARALTFPEAVTCSCFGTLGSPTVSRTTLLRNILLTVLGVVGLVAAARGDLAAAVTAHTGAWILWVLALVAATVLTALALGGTRAEAAPAGERTAGAAAGSVPARAHEAGAIADADIADDDELEYEREEIPFGMLVERVDGEERYVSVRETLSRAAQLMVWVTPGCGPCERTVDQMRGWSERLAPHVQLRAMLRQPFDTFSEEFLERTGEHASVDVEMNIATSLRSAGAPAAMLLGADGLTAGGPVFGGPAVAEFVEQVIAQIEEAELPEDGRETAKTGEPGENEGVAETSGL